MCPDSSATDAQRGRAAECGFSRSQPDLLSTTRDNSVESITQLTCSSDKNGVTCSRPPRQSLSPNTSGKSTDALWSSLYRLNYLYEISQSVLTFAIHWFYFLSQRLFMTDPCVFGALPELALHAAYNVWSVVWVALCHLYTVSQKSSHL